MATQDLGDLGSNRGEPLLFRWRWYYSVPNLCPWILLLLLAIVPRVNRNLQAWLILILPLWVHAIFWSIEATITGSIPELDSLAQFCATLSIAWAAAWLLGPWLRSGDRLRNASKALGTMLLIGAAGYVGFFGFWLAGDTTWPVVGFWSACAVTLAVATALSGYFCDSQCSPHRLLFWPAVWIPVLTVTCIGVFFVGQLVLVEGLETLLIDDLAWAALMLIVLSGGVAVWLYVLNLPVVLLCIFSPLYEERFRSGYGWPNEFLPVAATDQVGSVVQEPIGK